MRKGKLKDGRAAWFHGVFPCGDEQLQAPIVVVELEGGAMTSVEVGEFTFDNPAQAQDTVDNSPVAALALLEKWCIWWASGADVTISPFVETDIFCSRQRHQ